MLPATLAQHLGLGHLFDNHSSDAPVAEGVTGQYLQHHHAGLEQAELANSLGGPAIGLPGNRLLS